MSVLENLRIPLLYAAGSMRGSPRSRVTDEALRILEQVGLSDKAHALSGRLTQVDRRKLELARAMAAKPKLLISDEAMAGLSTAEVNDILGLLSGLKEQGVAVIMIEHAHACGDEILRTSRGSRGGSEDRRRRPGRPWRATWKW